MSVGFCSLLLVSREGGICGARFVPGPRYLPEGFFTVGPHTGGSACQGPSYCPSLPPPHVSKSAFPQEVLVVRFLVIGRVELGVGGWMYLKQRVGAQMCTHEMFL